MPVSTGSLGEPRAKRCKHCDESSHRSESGSGYWQLQLDSDLVETISAFYPEWFKSNMAEGGGSGGGCSTGGGGVAGGGGSTAMSTSNATPRESPPKAIVDTSPLLKSKEQNKESLKVKLMLRRPAEELRAQGIMPPLKTPAAFHGQRRQLERAKTGDLLKNKIQQRPSRYELESRHILEADPNVDPSLAEKQRMLKKARLADQLNDQLSHRPGPLELIQKNILHTEETIEHAVKSGHIPYRATCEGQLNRPQHPLSYINPEDDSQSSEDNNVSASPPTSNSLDVLETAAKSAGIVVSLLPTTVSEGTATALVVARTTPVVNTTTTTNTSPPQSLKDNSEIFADLCRSVAAPLLHSQQSSPASLVSSTSTLSPLSSIASPVPSIVSQPPTPAAPPLPLTPRPIQSPIRSDAPGKDKNRKKSKSKAIPKTRTIKFHEYKGPPSAQKNTSNNAVPGESSYDLLLQQQTLLLQFQLQLQHKYPQIILPASQKSPNSESSCQPISNNNSNSSASPSPAPSMESVTSVNPTRLVGRLEDMKVSDLKAELKRRNLPVSGSKPHLIERLKSNLNNNTNQETSSMVPSSADESSQHTDICGGSPIKTETDIKSEPMEICNPLSPIMLNDIKTQEEIVREQKRQIEELQRELTLSQLKLQAATMVEPKAQSFALKKHIQARLQQQPMVIQMQHLQALHNEEQQKLQQQQHVAFQNQKNNQLLLNHNTAALVLNHLNRVKGNRNYFIANEVQEEKPPPIYEEAIKKEVAKSNIKSQTVDDVLEILIKNGELPASAAQEPITPNSKPNEPAYPINSPESGLELDTSDLLETLDSLENMDFSQLIEMSGHHQQQQQTQNQVQQQQQHIMNNHDVLSSSNTVVPMDTDDWLESLLPSDIQCNNNNNNNNNNNSVISMQQDLIYDPLMGITQEPFDPFCLEEFRPQPASEMALSWGDKVDFAA